MEHTWTNFWIIFLILSAQGTIYSIVARYTWTPKRKPPRPSIWKGILATLLIAFVVAIVGFINIVFTIVGWLTFAFLFFYYLWAIPKDIRGRKDK